MRLNKEMIINTGKTIKMCTCEFGLAFAFEKLMIQAFGKDNARLCAHYHSSVLKRLEVIRDSCVSENSSLDDGLIANDAPIWTFWDKGFDSAPELIQACRESRQVHRGLHPLVELDMNSIKDLISVPAGIEEAFTSGKMGLACFSDFIRLSLLSEYGGVWADATVFMVNDFPSELYEHSFFSLRHQVNSPFYVSEGKWTAWFLGCGESNSYLKACRDLFVHYWDQYNVLIDYFLIDFVLSSIRSSSQRYMDQIDSIPDCLASPMFLQRELSKSNQELSIGEKTALCPVQKLNFRAPVTQPVLDSLRCLIY